MDDYAVALGEARRPGGELVVRALDALEAGELEFTEQDDAKATYAEKISPEERHLDPSQAARRSSSGRCGRSDPHIGAYLELEDGSRLGVRAGACRPGWARRRGAIEVQGRRARARLRPTGRSGWKWSSRPERSR